MGTLDTILFTIGGNGVSLAELISVILGLSCVFLAGRGKVLNFWFGYFYNIFLFVLFASHHLYFSMALQPVSFIINLIGHYRWTHPREGEQNARNELKITRLTTPYRARYIIFVVMLALIMGWAMQEASVIWPGAFPPAQRPFLDAFVVMMILTAQYLSAQKKMECWFAWVVVNTTNIVLYILAGLVFMPVVSACYLVLAWFGFNSWRKLMKEQD
ncbi:MAG: nicotinamide mononucleotide transporter [Bacteroidales bacterium]|nr:nicotinamide mononucleotide transporter [Bacteroidales bacterium]